MAGNANSGRRPRLSNAERKLLGFPPSRRNDLEPIVPAVEVKRPAWLSKLAGSVWDELAPIAIEMQTLTIADVCAFGRLCELEATSRQASQRKAAADPAEAKAAVKVERDNANALKSYYEAFGLTPSGRTRLRVPRREPPLGIMSALGFNGLNTSAKTIPSSL